MMEDSCWLDTYQSSILDGCSKPIKKIELLDEENSCSEQSSIAWDVVTLSSSSTDVASVTKPLDVEEMPAFEFLRDNKSCVAAETLNLVKRFMPSFRKSLAPRHDLSFKKPRA